MRDKTEQLERALLAQERTYNDRLEALDRNMTRQLDSLRNELGDRTQTLKATSSLNESFVFQCVEKYFQRI
jgi:prefoldin subunit 5